MPQQIYATELSRELSSSSIDQYAAQQEEDIGNVHQLRYFYFHTLRKGSFIHRLRLSTLDPKRAGILWVTRTVQKNKVQDHNLLL